MKKYDSTCFRPYRVTKQEPTRARGQNQGRPTPLPAFPRQGGSGAEAPGKFSAEDDLLLRRCVQEHERSHSTVKARSPSKAPPMVQSLNVGYAMRDSIDSEGCEGTGGLQSSLEEGHGGEYLKNEMIVSINN